MNNTEKEFLENFYKNMNSDKADYKKDNTDDVFYYSFSEIKENKSIDEELNTKENDSFELVRVDNSNSNIGFSKFVFDNFDLERIKEALESESFKLPSGLSIEEKIEYILNFDRIKENLNSELIIMPDDIHTPEDIRNFILSHADIKLENIADNDKIEVIKSLLDNK